MLCSVIVPFFKEEAYIENCIQSLLKQDLERDQFELIFVNNNSIDKSPDIVSQYPDILLLHESKQGSYHALNKGLDMAQGEIIAFTNPDCTVSDDWLSQIVKGIKEDKASIVLGERFFSGTSNPLRIFQDYENAKIEYILSRLSSNYYFGYANNMGVRRELFDAVGPFLDIGGSADTEFVHRCLKNDPHLKVAYLKNMRICHLEITRTREWVRKLISYGRDNEKISKSLGYLKLRWMDKMKIFDICFGGENYFTAERLVALFYLMCGEIAYREGILMSQIRDCLPFRIR